MRILLIEDDERIAADIAASLPEAGFALEHARDGVQGLSLGSAGGFAAIILDLFLPALDEGKEVPLTPPI